MAVDFGGIRNFSWVRDGALAGMAWPGPDAWSRLAREGVGAVLTLTERLPPGDPGEAGLVHHHVPIEDFGTPPLGTLREAVAWMREQIENGRPVVVHCRAGMGRTGLLIAAYLAADGLSANEAIAMVRSLRPGSIETSAQMKLVKQFGRAVGAGGRGHRA